MFRFAQHDNYGRLFLFLIRKTLRPGPARAESATPAAGPGERFARKCVVNNFGRSLRGTLAGLRCGRLRPALKNRTTRRHSLRKPLFRILRRIPSSDCFTMPAAGSRHDGSGALDKVGEHGTMYSSSPLALGVRLAGVFGFRAAEVDPLGIGSRARAFPVRCVQHLPIGTAGAARHGRPRPPARNTKWHR